MLKNYHINARHVEHTVQPTNDQIDAYFKAMQTRGCQFVVCIMDTRTEEERNQLKLTIKDCATIRYGELHNRMRKLSLRSLLFCVS